MDFPNAIIYAKLGYAVNNKVRLWVCTSTNQLQVLLEKRDWILADGATGTNLFNMGLPSGDAP